MLRCHRDDVANTTYPQIMPVLNQGIVCVMPDVGGLTDGQARPSPENHTQYYKHVYPSPACM